MAEGTVDSAAWALRILRLLEDGHPRGLTEIAAELGLTNSRCHRLLATLVGEGYVFRLSGDRLYRATRRPGGASSLEGFSVVLEQAFDVLKEMRDASDETTHLAALAGHYVYFVAAAESHRQMRVTSRVGMRLPAHATAVGKVLLAQWTPTAVRALLESAGLPGFTDRTITDQSEFLEELANARTSGFARNLSESESGMAALAVTIPMHDQTSYLSLSISGPESRINPRRSRGLSAIERRHLALLQEGAQTIAQRSGS